MREPFDISTSYARLGKEEKMRFYFFIRNFMKICTLFYKRLMQRSGVWIAVLLIHVFLWIALEKGRDVPKSRQNAFTYLSVIQIALNDPPTHAPKVSTSSKIISIKQHAIRGIETPGSKIAAPEMRIKKKKAKELVSAEEISVVSKPPSLPINDGASKQIVTLDYDAMRRIALSTAHASERRQLPGAEKQLSGAQKFAEVIEHNKRADCRSAYSHLQVLIAIPLLLKDTLTDSGCRW